MGRGVWRMENRRGVGDERGVVLGVVAMKTLHTARLHENVVNRGTLSTELHAPRKRTRGPQRSWTR